MSAPEALIACENVEKRFHIGKSNEVLALKPLSMSVLPQSGVLLTGPSGSGKSTLLSILACLSKPSAGAYYCQGEAVSRWPEKFLTRFRRQHLGMIFQEFQLISGLSAYQNISLPLIPLPYSRAQIDKNVQEAAKLVGITHRLKFEVDVLSGGEKQRVAIARALVNRPSILIADEPTAHLDRENSLKILDIFNDLKNKGITLLVSTHDPLVESHPWVDRKLRMDDGILQEENTA